MSQLDELRKLKELLDAGILSEAEYDTQKTSLLASIRSGGNDDGRKSKITAGLLGIFLGVFGVHNFYLGYTGKAVIQLILGITLIGASASGLWGLIEGIMILSGSIKTDGKGNPLRD
jgi:TM2 domain-containing membrane protein YozV